MPGPGNSNKPHLNIIPIQRSTALINHLPINPKTYREQPVETTGFHWAVHAVETMDANILAPLLPVKICLDEIDKLGNVPLCRLHIFPSNVSVAPSRP